MNTAGRLTAETLGSVLLAAAVVGSGVMAERLAGGNTAIAFLVNTGATIAVLATLIALLGPISGAHFNLGCAANFPGERPAPRQSSKILGCRAGVVLAHAIFDLPWLHSSAHMRTFPSRWLAEGVATFGLLLVVLGHRRPEDAPWMVAAWIGGAYWFTASTSFANPARQSPVRCEIPLWGPVRVTCRDSSRRSWWARYWRCWWYDSFSGPALRRAHYPLLGPPHPPEPHASKSIHDALEILSRSYQAG